MKLKDLLNDFFVENITVPEIDIMTGMKHTIVFTAEDKTIYMRTYSIKINKDNLDKEDLVSSHNASAVNLTEIGPSANLVFRRE